MRRYKKQKVLSTKSLIIRMRSSLLNFFQLFSDIIELDESKLDPLLQKALNLTSKKIKDAKLNESISFQFLKELHEIDKSMDELVYITEYDSKVLWREVEELLDLRNVINTLPTKPHLEAVNYLLTEYSHAIHHIWASAAGLEKGLTQLSHINLRSVESHRYMMKKEDNELLNLQHHHMNLLDDLHNAKTVLERVQAIGEIVALEEHELKDILHIFHEVHTMMHAVEKLVYHLKSKANQLAISGMVKHVSTTEEKIKKLFKSLERQLHTEMNEIYKEVSKIKSVDGEQGSNNLFKKVA